VGRTLRSKRLRAVLYCAANGKCQICGEELGEDWHADHVVPWSVTNRTNVHEMQALCSACNLRKGKTMPRNLRQHQLEMVAIARKIASVKKSNFRVLAHVVCGGGKSWLPGLLMEHMPPNIKLCWAVPRLALQEQAVQDTAKEFGLVLRDAGNDVNPSRDRRGVVVTHQSICQAVDLWKDEFSRHPYILLIDEPHHAKISKQGELNELAKFIQATEKNCIGLVYMTGTLSTGDNKYIYGVKYEENQNKKEQPTSDGFDYVIRYKREEALKEKALVPIEFYHHDGPVKWESIKSGDSTEVILSQADKEDEGDAIWTALTTDIADSLFEKGYAHWKSYGNKLLIVCHSQASARKWHNELLKRGEHSFLAVTENDEALEHIKKFKSKPRSVLVTCAMAYEGLDERPLSHVVCLTHIRSVPWIEQMLARVWRANNGKVVCHAFVTDDPRMRRVIEAIKAEQPDAKSMKEGTCGGEGGCGDRDTLPIESKHELTRMTGLDTEVPFASLNEKQLDVYEKLVGFGLDPDSDNFKGIIEELSTKDETKLNGELTDKQRETAIRNRIAGKCRQVDKEKYSSVFGTTQSKLVAKNKKRLADLNIHELKRSLEYVESLLS